MGLLSSLFGLAKVPDGVAGSTMILADASTLAGAGALVQALQQKFGNVAVALEGAAPTGMDLPALVLPDRADKAQSLLTKAAPARLIVVGGGESWVPLARAVPNTYWINAGDATAAKANCKQVMVSDPARLESIPGATLTGDPLLDLTSLPPVTPQPDICERFKEQREGDRWLGYFAATGEDEEEMAYPIFNRLIRYKMGVMVLAPRDQARCEPVYREAIKYRLQTIRHRRLSTSFVPIKTRVYYVEDPEPLEALYQCVDFVVAGGTLHENASNPPDLISPIQHGKPVVVGGAHRNDPLVKSAVAAGAVLAGADAEGVFEQARKIIDDPAFAARQAESARQWLGAQVGALERVLSLIA